MGRLIVNSFVTLDGVMQAPGAPDEDRSNGFARGGWSVPFWTGEMLERVAGITEGMDAFLIGRGTYDIFAAHWPHVTDPADRVAAVLNRVPKTVVTRAPRALAWQNAVATSGDDLPGIVARLKAAHREIQVHGSPGLLQSLNALGLVDQYDLWTFPVCVGAGKRLFGDDVALSGYRLLDVHAFDSGVTLARYERGPAPTFGTWGEG